MKKVLKIFLFIILILFVLILGFLTVRYLSDKSPYKTFLLPRVELAFVEITSLTTEKTEMNLKLLIKNQLPFAFTADSLQYSIYADSVEIIEDRYKKSIHLESNDSSWINLPVTFFNRRLENVNAENDQKNIDTVEYRIKASFFSNFIFRRKFNLEIKRRLPLIYIPVATVEHLEIDSLNFARAAIRLQVSLNNKNVFPLQAKNIAYRFEIEDHEWIEGIRPGLLDIEAQKITRFEIPMRLSFKQVSKTLFALLTKGKKVGYKLNLTFRIESENNQVKNSKVILQSSGTVKSLMKVVNNKKNVEKKRKKALKNKKVVVKNKN